MNFKGLGIREDGIVTLTIDEARHMPTDELRDRFVAVINEGVGDSGRLFLPRDFPNEFTRLTREGMLELILRHRFIFCPPEILEKRGQPISAEERQQWREEMQKRLGEEYPEAAS